MSLEGINFFCEASLSKLVENDMRKLDDCIYLLSWLNKLYEFSFKLKD